MKSPADPFPTGSPYDDDDDEPRPDREDIEEATLYYYLYRSPGTDRLKFVSSQKDLVTQLKAKGFTRFIPEGPDNPKRRSYAVTENRIRDLIDQALAKYPVHLRTGKKWRHAESSFADSVRDLKKRYELVEVAVAPALSPNPEATTPPMAQLTAEMFSRLIDRHPSEQPKVGIGGGSTLSDMLVWLTPPEKRFQVFPINYATCSSKMEIYDSSHLATAVQKRCKYTSTCDPLGLPPLPPEDVKGAASWHSHLFGLNNYISSSFSNILAPDIVFVGTAPFNEKSASIERFYTHLGIDYEKLVDMRPQPAGDINLCFFDQAGNDITWRIVEEHLQNDFPELSGGSFFPKQPYCHSFLVGLNIACLKDLVEKRKTVVLVAGGGKAKAKAIRICLNAKIANALVTDEVTMKNLLDLQE